MDRMSVTITAEAIAQAAELPQVIQARIDDVIERLERWPRVSGVKRLTGDWAGLARIRTGDYRIIFEIRRSEIRIVRIAHRSDAYAE